MQLTALLLASCHFAFASVLPLAFQQRGLLSRATNSSSPCQPGPQYCSLETECCAIGYTCVADEHCCPIGDVWCDGCCPAKNCQNDILCMPTTAPQSPPPRPTTAPRPPPTPPPQPPPQPTTAPAPTPAPQSPPLQPTSAPPPAPAPAPQSPPAAVTLTTVTVSMTPLVTVTPPSSSSSSSSSSSVSLQGSFVSNSPNPTGGATSTKLTMGETIFGFTIMILIMSWDLL